MPPLQENNLDPRSRRRKSIPLLKEDMCTPRVIGALLENKPPSVDPSTDAAIQHGWEIGSLEENNLGPKHLNQALPASAPRSLFGYHLRRKLPTQYCLDRGA